MVRRLIIVVWALWSIFVVGRAPAQETGRPTTAPALADRTDWQAEGTHGAVAAGGRDAVAAGLEILKKGGNAADSAAATIFALSVTDSRSFCFGGEVPIMIFDAKRQGVEVLCGLGTAPRLATREYFAKKGSIPAKGIEPAAVPGLLDGVLTLLERTARRRIG